VRRRRAQAHGVIALDARGLGQVVHGAPVSCRGRAVT
jgi:hypothetical protein